MNQYLQIMLPVIAEGKKKTLLNAEEIEKLKVVAKEHELSVGRFINTLIKKKIK